MSNEVLASYPIKCEGVGAQDTPPLLDNPAQPSLTIYRDGARSVGCPYLNPQAGACCASELPEPRIYSNRCIQLYPVTVAAYSQFIKELDPTLNDVYKDLIGLTSYAEAINYFTSRMNISNKEFARLSDIAPASLSRIKKGSRNIGVKTLIKQIEVLNLNQSDARIFAQLAGHPEFIDEIS